MRQVDVPGLSPGPALAPDAVLAGGLLIVAQGTLLFAVDLERARVAWTHEWTRPDPVHQQVPRRPYANGRRVWARGGRVACLSANHGGVVVTACDVRTGREQWRRELPTPPPAAFTEATPAWAGAQTEEIEACFLTTDELVVAFARNTRRTRRYPELTMPPLAAQLDLCRLDPDSGAIMRRAELPGVFVPILEKDALGRWLARGPQVLELDPAALTARVHAELPADVCWPRAVPGGVAVACKLRGKVMVAAAGREATWKRTAVKRLVLHPLSDGLALQVNDQFVVALADDLSPRWEARIKPYIYGVCARAGGPLYVAAAGGGGGLSAFARDSGKPLLEARLDGGAWHPVASAGGDVVFAVCGDGLATVRGKKPVLEVTKLAGVRSIAATWDGGVALLRGAPSPGVLLIP